MILERLLDTFRSAMPELVNSVRKSYRIETVCMQEQQQVSSPMSRNFLRRLQRPIVQTLRNSKPFVIAVAAAGVVVGRGGGDNQRLHCPLLTGTPNFMEANVDPIYPTLSAEALQTPPDSPASDPGGGRKRNVQTTWKPSIILYNNIPDTPL